MTGRGNTVAGPAGTSSTSSTKGSRFHAVGWAAGIAAALIVGGILLAAGAFLPWLQASLHGASRTAAGNVLAQGWACFSFGIAVLLATGFWLVSGRGPSPEERSGRTALSGFVIFGLGVAGLVCLVVSLSSIRSGERAARAIPGISAGIGIGYWLCVAGAIIALLLGGLLLIRGVRAGALANLRRAPKATAVPAWSPQYGPSAAPPSYQAGFPQAAGHSPQPGSSSPPGYSPQPAYGAQPGSSSPPGYSPQPAYGAQTGSSSPPGYGPQPGYGAQTGLQGQAPSGYAGQPNYAPQPTYGAQPNSQRPQAPYGPQSTPPGSQPPYPYGQQPAPSAQQPAYGQPSNYRSSPEGARPQGPPDAVSPQPAQPQAAQRQAGQPDSNQPPTQPGQPQWGQSNQPSPWGQTQGAQTGGGTTAPGQPAAPAAQAPAPVPPVPQPQYARPAQPAGWYRDPSGQHTLRWWNGANWTEHTHDQAR